MSSLQQTTLQLYGELLARTPEDGWPGKLILSTQSSNGLSAAACIAGATCLTIDADQQTVRTTYRDGGFDFLVNTLDEALRALKNEMRQKRPLAIALPLDPKPVLTEAHDRGVLADLAINTPGAPARTHLELTSEPSPALISWLEARSWSPQTIPPHTSPLALSQDDPRHAWLRQLPRYQRSAAREPRLLWLSK